MKLSLQALETLAVIAYKQPVTAPEITEIRGVDSGGVLGSLLAASSSPPPAASRSSAAPSSTKPPRTSSSASASKIVSELPSMEEFEKMGEPRPFKSLSPEKPLFPLLRYRLHLGANQTLQPRQALLQGCVLHLQLLLKTLRFPAVAP